MQVGSWNPSQSGKNGLTFPRNRYCHKVVAIHGQGANWRVDGVTNLEDTKPVANESGCILRGRRLPTTVHDLPETIHRHRA